MRKAAKSRRHQQRHEKIGRAQADRVGEIAEGQRRDKNGDADAEHDAGARGIGGRAGGRDGEAQGQRIGLRDAEAKDEHARQAPLSDRRSPIEPEADQRDEERAGEERTVGTKTHEPGAREPAEDHAEEEERRAGRGFALREADQPVSRKVGAQRSTENSIATASASATACGQYAAGSRAMLTRRGLWLRHGNARIGADDDHADRDGRRTGRSATRSRAIPRRRPRAARGCLKMYETRFASAKAISRRGP